MIYKNSLDSNHKM